MFIMHHQLHRCNRATRKNHALQHTFFEKTEKRGHHRDVRVILLNIYTLSLPQKQQYLH
jgi:hypothetical protein